MIVKAARERRTPNRPRGYAVNLRQDAAAGRGEPRPYKRRQDDDVRRQDGDIKSPLQARSARAIREMRVAWSS